jgi:hypothetical protein
VFAKRGVEVVYGSDVPIDAYDPWLALKVGVTRTGDRHNPGSGAPTAHLLCFAHSGFSCFHKPRVPQADQQASRLDALASLAGYHSVRQRVAEDGQARRFPGGREVCGLANPEERLLQAERRHDRSERSMLRHDGSAVLMRGSRS